jgi:hypothetical protein
VFNATGGSSSGGLGGSGGGGGIGAIGGSGGSGTIDAPPDAPLGDAPSDAIDTDADASDAREGGTCSDNIERCNGLDDNCNDTIDEGNPGGGAACTVAGGIGVCAEGRRECVAASLKCVANVASAEICDGLDNDCDTEVDEGDPDSGQQCNSGLEGVCAAGVTHCLNGKVECVAEFSPQPEECNGADDDCDGRPDNGFPGAGDPCTVTGQLAGTPCADGLTTCSLGGVNECAQTYFASTETCDGEDNDCDGVNDNASELENKACDTGLPGVCSTGKTRCDYAANQALTCEPDIEPGTRSEICNDADDDCNGQTDDIANLSAECGATYPSAQHVAAWACTQAACQIVTCAAGYKDCNGAANDGCEVDTQTSVQNCGACGTACSSANGTASCTGGSCSIACNAGFGNCDNDARTNGCEINTNTNTQHCGGCGTGCNSSNGTATCSSGNCSINCNSGFGNCDNNARSNGCEANFATNTSNCGSCGAACSSANGTATCSSGNCSITCNSGFDNCDNNARSNGCEVNLKTDATHCGTCSTVCSGVPCTAGVCCAAGANTDGDCSDDCTEVADNDPWTDATKFNGVHVRHKDHCSLLASCLDNNTLSAEQSCMSGTIREEKDQCAGWNFNDSPDSICSASYGFIPNWTVCDTNWAAEWKGYINLTGSGNHCFAVTTSLISGGGCASLYFNTETNGLQSGAGTRCYNVSAGVYPILWHYTMSNASTSAMHVQYCFGGGTTCTPSAAIPASMLRPTYP